MAMASSVHKHSGFIVLRCCRMSVAFRVPAWHCPRMVLPVSKISPIKSIIIELATAENVAVDRQFSNRRSPLYSGGAKACSLYIATCGLRTNPTVTTAPSLPRTPSTCLRLFSRSASPRRRLALSALPRSSSARR